MAKKIPPEKHKPKTQSLKRSQRFFEPKYLVLLAVFVAIGAYAIWRIFAAPPPPTIYLSPASQTLPASTSFTVQVRENSGTTGVNAVQANVSYDATLVDYVSSSLTNSAFGVTAQNTGGSGSVNIGLGTCGGCTPATGDQLVATITFKSKTITGTTNMAFLAGTALVSASSNTDILTSNAGGSYLVDTTAPTVNLLAPANGASISSIGNTTISSNAADNDKVSSVDVYVDGVKKTTLTTAPYNYTWSVTGTSLGSHTIQSKATDPSGNVGSSSTITVNVTDQTAPTVSITSPAANAALKGTVPINVTAADTGGTSITKVEFYVDGTLKSTATTAPYSYSWDSTTATNASHSLTAKAYDGATPANITTSSAVSVTVDNSPPTTPGNFHTTGNTQTSIALAWNASTDNVAVTGYRISRNGTTITTTSGSTLSYNDTGVSAGTSYSYSVVALDALGNASVPATLTASTLSAIAGDCNGDNHVTITDLSILLSNFNTNYASCDFNHDSIVNIFDLSTLLSNFGT